MSDDSQSAVEVDGVVYPLDLEELSFGDARTLKLVGGVALGDVQTALEHGDMDVLLALALIAMRRKDPTVREETLLARPIHTVRFMWPDDNEEPPNPPNGAAPAE